MCVCVAPCLSLYNESFLKKKSCNTRQCFRYKRYRSMIPFNDLCHDDDDDNDNDDVICYYQCYDIVI